MIRIVPSSVDPQWFEVQDGGVVVQEVQIRFPLRFIPKSFPSIEAALEWLNNIERKLVKARAYRLIAARSYPSTLLLAKLTEKGYALTICQEIVQELERLGYVEDEAWIKRLIEREFQRGIGPRLIEMKLKAKGLSGASVRTTITSSMQRKKIGELLKKNGSLPRQKRIQSLARKGFDLEFILEAIPN